MPLFKGECGTRLTLTNIVGGRKTKFGDYPYMVLIGYDVDGNKPFHVIGTIFWDGNFGMKIRKFVMKIK